MSMQSSAAVFHPATASSPAARPPRVLACMLCQQRKVRCDREVPCANCIRAGVQCVPATGPRQRRRRFPERELLERLRRYEGLLRKNNIEFEPMHAPAAEKLCQSENSRGSVTLNNARPAGPAAGAGQTSNEKINVKDETSYEAKNFWHLMNQMGKSLDSEDDDENDDGDTDGKDSSFRQDDVRETVVEKAWDQVYEGDDQNLLFGSSKTNVDLSTSHPEQVQIFRLWQIYLENVNPLLKVTHTPTLQSRIIEAAGDLANISPTLEALMFSIYCVSILSLGEDECCAMFKAPKEDLLKGYQFGCRQALLNCGVLRTGSRDCLTALYLYLVSVRPHTDPRSLSSMLGLAIRIAQRMGIDNEATYSRCTALEGEMRRRLWWSLIMFDNRICEMSNHKTTMLIPTWDCRSPLNINDFDIRPEMKSPPPSHDKPTEALFAVVRSEMGEFIRHSAFHLDFTNPSLKKIVKHTQHDPVLESGRLIAFEKTIEDKYLRFCIPENPLHFMTIWTTRGHLAKIRLMEHYLRHSSMQQTDAQRGTAISYALSILECDTKLMTSPLTKGYLWLSQFYFPFPAYIHILKNLKKRPILEDAKRAWAIMSDNYEARFKDMQKANPFFEFFSTIVLQAWEACEAASRQIQKPLQSPRIVSDIKQRVAQLMPHTLNSDAQQPKCAPNMNINDLSISMTMDFGSHDLLYSMDGQGFAGAGPGGYPDMLGQATMDVEVNQFNWATIDSYPMHDRNW